MLGTPKTVVARPTKEVFVDSDLNMSFSSDYNLDKIVKIIKTNGPATAASTAHGLGYTPRVMSMLKDGSSKFAWSKNGGADSTNIYATAGSGQTAYTVVLLDPVVSGSYSKDMGNTPLFEIKGTLNGDPNSKLHSGYDTFKVAKTGRLEINASAYNPGAGGGTVTSTATYNHGLGYVPMYAPFIPREVSLWFYFFSTTGVDDRGEWASGVYYYAGETVTIFDPEGYYYCKQGHTSSASTKPGVGANWQQYWGEGEPSDAITLTDIYMNKLEDYRPSFVTFGDEGDHNDAVVKLEVTSTQLILTLTRTVNPSQEPFYTYQPYPATHAYVDYTIFYNKADEELNLS